MELKSYQFHKICFPVSEIEWLVWNTKQLLNFVSNSIELVALLYQGIGRL